MSSETKEVVGIIICVLGALIFLFGVASMGYVAGKDDAIEQIQAQMIMCDDNLDFAKDDVEYQYYSAKRKERAQEILIEKLSESLRNPPSKTPDKAT